MTKREVFQKSAEMFERILARVTKMPCDTWISIWDEKRLEWRGEGNGGDVFHCHCCEYAGATQGNVTDEACRRCPALALWGTPKNVRVFGACERSRSSPYHHLHRNARTAAEALPHLRRMIDWFRAAEAEEAEAERKAREEEAERKAKEYVHKMWQPGVPPGLYLRLQECGGAGGTDLVVVDQSGERVCGGFLLCFQATSYVLVGEVSLSIPIPRGSRDRVKFGA